MGGGGGVSQPPPPPSPQDRRLCSSSPYRNITLWDYNEISNSKALTRFARSCFLLQFIVTGFAHYDFALTTLFRMS